MAGEDGRDNSGNDINKAVMRYLTSRISRWYRYHFQQERKRDACLASRPRATVQKLNVLGVASMTSSLACWYSTSGNTFGPCGKLFQRNVFQLFSVIG